MSGKSLNKNVADFTHKGRKYEIDLLLDTVSSGFPVYDIFDVTNNKIGNSVGQFTLPKGDYMPSDLIREAIKEL